MLCSHEGFSVLFADALKIAGELDAHFAATNELKGPLHGVPITFKDLSELEVRF
jgi:Asp-tRNA(Asn)/Glu-tRNA(Gln) amidotransferase A subunit family amidase